MLVAGLLGQPTLCLIDEPTNGLDPEGVKLLAGLVAELKDRGALAVIATHDLEFVDMLAATKVHMHRGRIDTGSQ